MREVALVILVMQKQVVTIWFSISLIAWNG